MARNKLDRSAKTIWMYMYEIVPPQSEIRLAIITTILACEHADAERQGRAWAARVVHGQHFTRILIVTDSPIQTQAVNDALEAEFKALKSVASITAPMAVGDRQPLPPPQTD